MKRIHPSMEFHVSRAARDRYRFDEALFGVRGNVLIPDFAAARRFAQQMNARRDLAKDPGAAVRAGDINAMGLVDEVNHMVVDLYRRDRNPEAMTGALAALEERLTAPVLDATLTAFAEHFPNVQSYRDETSAVDYLAGETDGVPNREIVLEEMLLLWLSNMNPGFAAHEELFDDAPLELGSAYVALIGGLRDWFENQPGFGPYDEDLITLLRRPALEAGATLREQLRWIADNWGFAAKKIGDRLTVSLDVLAEEERAVWMRFHATEGGAERDREEGSTEAFESAALHGFDDEQASGGYSGGEPEVEAFSLDLDWMPRVVLLAKSTYVWLDQLSRAYNRAV
ncbi:MAG: alpha-amylase, partial [Candidatus Limnocylindrales bacterium]